MKITQKKILLMVIIFSMLSCIIANAATPRWSHLTMISGQMKVDDGNRALVTVVCDATTDKTNLLQATCELQQLDGSWKTIKTWTEENKGASLLYSKHYAIEKGYSYRLKITARAYQNSNLLETVTEYFDYGYYK